MTTDAKPIKKSRRSAKKDLIGVCAGDPLEFIGLYINLNRVSEHLPLPVSNIRAYINNRVHDLGGYVVVQVITNDGPIPIDTIKDDVVLMAEKRNQKAKLALLSPKELKGLSEEKQRKILEILKQ